MGGVEQVSSAREQATRERRVEKKEESGLGNRRMSMSREKPSVKEIVMK